MHNIRLYEYGLTTQIPMDQNEEVQPVATSTEFGVDNTGYGPFINDRLQHVRRH
jgi:hypothetical protein